MRFIVFPLILALAATTPGRADPGRRPTRSSPK